jgi:hypothetical protein
MGVPEAFREEVPSRCLAEGPADESRAIVANIAILPGRVVVRRSLAGAAAPGVGRAGRGHGLGQHCGTHGGAGRRRRRRPVGDAALHVVAPGTRPWRTTAGVEGATGAAGRGARAGSGAAVHSACVAGLQG